MTNRRNIEWTAEASTPAGVLFAVEHFATEAGARAAALVCLGLAPEAVAYVDIAEKWEEPRSALRNPGNVPVRYRYTARIFRDREWPLGTSEDNRAVLAEVGS